MWIIFGVCIFVFFAMFIYVCIDQWHANNSLLDHYERTSRHVDSGGYRPSISTVQPWDHKLGSLETLHLSEDNDNGRKDS